MQYPVCSLMNSLVTTQQPRFRGQTKTFTSDTIVVPHFIRVKVTRDNRDALNDSSLLVV